MKTTKKIMVFAVLMCCLVSASAQQTNSMSEPLKTQRLNRNESNLTVKLDSITDGWFRHIFEYDSQLHCTRQTTYCDGTNGWYVCFSHEYSYDDLGRMISIRSYDNGAVKKTEYIYNEQSLLSEAIQSYYNGTNWHFQYKYNYGYDEAGNQTLFIQYEYDDDHWAEKEKKVWEYEESLPQSMVRYVVGYAFEKTIYSYNAQGYCTEMTRCYRNTEPGWYEEWGAYYKECYEYDEAGNMLSRVSLRMNTNYQEWYYSEKTELAYDENNNCTQIGIYGSYDYDTEQWTILKNALDFSFDHTISIDNISGLPLFWEHWLDDFDLSVPVFNEMQHITFYNLGQITQWDFYYSNFNGLDEPTDNHLNVWPNPATETAHIEEAEEVQVYNALGQIVRTVRRTNDIDLSGLANGVYLLRITDAEGRSHAVRVVVE